MIIRKATIEDLREITDVEAACFPEAEAASEESFKKRLNHFADRFWLLYDGDKLVSFVNGMVTNDTDLVDEMFADASLHDENGDCLLYTSTNKRNLLQCYTNSSKIF